MLRYDYFAVLAGEKYVEYLGSLYECISTDITGCYLSSLDCGYCIHVRYRRLATSDEFTAVSIDKASRNGV